MGRWSLGDGKIFQDEQIGEHLILTCFNCCLWAKWEHNRQSASASLTFGFDIESINAPPLICFPSQNKNELYVNCMLMAVILLMAISILLWWHFWSSWQYVRPHTHVTQNCYSHFLNDTRIFLMREYECILVGSYWMAPMTTHTKHSMHAIM